MANYVTLEQDIFKVFEKRGIKVEKIVVDVKHGTYTINVSYPNDVKEFVEHKPLSDDKYAEVLCQSCRKVKVKVLKNHPYFGILCTNCMKGNIYTVKRE
jgi:hypothetical protein